MYRHYNRQFQRNVAIIHPGEYLASRDDIIISTVLGSCVAVALYDPLTGYGGLNHFMLPGAFHKERHFVEESARYGLYAMELLLNELIKAGVRKANVKAKVFGGGHVLHDTTAGTIPSSNIEFAFTFLNTERIPVVSHNVGGTEARKVLFFVRDARVLLKRFGGKTAVGVERHERKYLEEIRHRKEAKPAEDVTLF